MNRTIMIYEETGSDFNPKQPIISFPVGRSIPREKMDEMFAEAAKTLGVNESRLVYEIFS